MRSSRSLPAAAKQLAGIGHGQAGAWVEYMEKGIS